MSACLWFNMLNRCQHPWMRKHALNGCLVTQCMKRETEVMNSVRVPHHILFRKCTFIYRCKHSHFILIYSYLSKSKYIMLKNRKTLKTIYLSIHTQTHTRTIWAEPLAMDCLLDSSNKWWDSFIFRNWVGPQGEWRCKKQKKERR